MKRSTFCCRSYTELLRLVTLASIVGFQTVTAVCSSASCCTLLSVSSAFRFDLSILVESSSNFASTVAMESAAGGAIAPVCTWKRV